MSKVNAMQAIREARYAARMADRTAVAKAPAATAAAKTPAATAAATTPATTAATATTVAAATVAAVTTGPGLQPPVQVGEPFAVPDVPARPEAEPALALAEPIEEEARCGHRSMNNRTCRRVAGHPEKNHRYT